MKTVPTTPKVRGTTTHTMLQKKKLNQLTRIPSSILAAPQGQLPFRCFTAPGCSSRAAFLRRSARAPPWDALGSCTTQPVVARRQCAEGTAPCRTHRRVKTRQRIETQEAYHHLLAFLIVFGVLCGVFFWGGGLVLMICWDMLSARRGTSVRLDDKFSKARELRHASLQVGGCFEWFELGLWAVQNATYL